MEGCIWKKTLELCIHEVSFMKKSMHVIKILNQIVILVVSQPAFTRSKSTLKASKQYVKSVQR